MSSFYFESPKDFPAGVEISMDDVTETVLKYAELRLERDRMDMITPAFAAVVNAIQDSARSQVEDRAPAYMGADVGYSDAFELSNLQVVRLAVSLEDEDFSFELSGKYEIEGSLPVHGTSAEGDATDFDGEFDVRGGFSVSFHCGEETSVSNVEI